MVKSVISGVIVSYISYEIWGAEPATIGGIITILIVCGADAGSV